LWTGAAAPACAREPAEARPSAERLTGIQPGAGGVHHLLSLC